MTMNSQGWEQNRRWVGIAFLLFGLLFVLWAWGSWTYRTAKTGPIDKTVSESTAPTKPDPQKVIRSLPALLLMGGALVGVFLIGSLAVRRWSQTLREQSRRRMSPTRADDVWTKHRVPPLENDAVDDDAD